MNAETPVAQPTEHAVTPTEPTRSGRTYRPSVDIIERPDELLVLADVPGVRSEDVDVDFENGALTIHGRVRDRMPAGASPLVREYGVGDFYRTFVVNETVDAGRITAQCSNGVLTLRLPKTPAARPRKIEVREA